MGQGAPLVFRFGSETGEMGAKIFRFEAKKVFFLACFRMEEAKSEAKRRETSETETKWS